MKIINGGKKTLDESVAEMKRKAVSGLADNLATVMSAPEARLDREVKDMLRDAAAMEWTEADQRAADEVKEMERKQRIEKLLRVAGIPKMYQWKTLENFEVDDSNREAHRACLDYVLDWDTISEGVLERYGRPGLALFGDVGTGKSHLAAAVVDGLVRKYQVRAIYANVLHAFQRARDSFSNRAVNPIPVMTTCDFLVLDDLGSERPTPWALEQVIMIADFRLSEGLPLMITSNAVTWIGLQSMLLLELKGDDRDRAHMATAVGRIVDRLRQATGDPRVIKGKSRRRSIREYL